MDTQTVTTFANLLASLTDLRPSNLEHLQARASDVHAAALQIIADSDYPPELVRAFPVLDRFADRSDEELAVWWCRFSEWLESLDLETFHRINAEFVIGH